jgi:hypothetical protein
MLKYFGLSFFFIAEELIEKRRHHRWFKTRELANLPEEKEEEDLRKKYRDLPPSRFATLHVIERLAL